MVGDSRYKQVLDDMWELHVKKGTDYGSGADFLANLRASEDYGIPAWVGALIRQNDKLIRLKNAAKGVDLANESVEDSLIDNACYAVLALVLYRETRSSPPEIDEQEALDTEWQRVTRKQRN